MRKIALACLTLLILSIAWAPTARAEVKLPSVFGDHMVLQRDAKVTVWGKADPGEQITVSLSSPITNKLTYPVDADKRGNWQIKLPKIQAGTGYLLTIQGSKTKKPITITDVAFGEVWVASGQSNMAWVLANTENAKQAIADSANNNIRMWTAHRTVSDKPAFDVNGSWAVASPKTAGQFSAVAYYYAKQLHEKLGVPVGILHTSWGGTPIEAWTSTEALKSIDWAKPILNRFEVAKKSYPQRKAEYLASVKRWEKTRNGPPDDGEKKGFAKLGFDDSKWKTMKLPQSWEKAGLNKDGVMWYRRTIDLPKGWAGKDLKLELGPIDDGDKTFVNGKKVGETPPYFNGSYRIERSYKVPKALVKKGKLAIAIRVVDLNGEGGLWGKAEQMQLSLPGSDDKPVSLAGEWRYLFTAEITGANRPVRPRRLPFGPEHPHSPAGLYNAMIHPLLPYTIRGAIWYQGESNATRAQQYEKLFPGMIKDWRKQWGQGDFPFLFVQLANFRRATGYKDTAWAHLRDAQLQTHKSVKNTGMAVTIDIGDARDIHPRNKKDVGQRLARWALADAYKKDVVKSGPIYTKHAAENKTMLVWFNNHGSAMKSRDGKPLRGFVIAGKDGKFYKADAVIAPFKPGSANPADSWYVVVSSKRVKKPVAVRYAWEDNPDQANLVNEQGLPASPFRTDDFKGPTDGVR